MRQLMVLLVIATLCLAPVAYGDQALDDALIQAARNGNLAEVKALLAQGADVNAKANNGVTPLWMAAHNDRLVVVKFLIAKGADVNAQTPDGQTALNTAAFWGHLRVVKTLLAKGAKVRAEDVKTAALYDHQDVVQVIKAKLPQGEAQGGGGKRKRVQFGTKEWHDQLAFFSAISKGDLPKVQAFLAQGADPNALYSIEAEEESDAPTVLMMAVLKGHLPVVQALLDKGANVNEKDHKGQTALMIAEGKGYTEIANALRRAGAR
jgi:ankyrin repeat protein